MAMIATTPANINPNPATMEDHRRNWQQIAIMLVGPGVSLDDGGGLNAAYRLTVITPTRLLVNGANSVTLTGYQSTVTLTDRPQAANKAYMGPASGTVTVAPEFRSIVPLDFGTGSGAAKVLTIAAGDVMYWATPATPLITAVDTANGLYMNGSTLMQSQTSSMHFGAIVCAGSMSAASALITAGTITTFAAANATVTNMTASGVANLGTLVFAGTTGTLTNGGAWAIPGVATMSGWALGSNIASFSGTTVTLAGVTQLNLANSVKINGSSTGSFPNADIYIQALGRTIFRGLSGFSPTWSDAVASCFFQVGSSSTGGGNTLFTSEFGGAFPRLGFYSKGTIFTDMSYVRMVPPGAILHAQNTTENSVANKVLLVRGAVGQTGNLEEGQNSGSVTLWNFDKDGILSLNATGSHTIAGSLTITKNLLANGTANTVGNFTASGYIAPSGLANGALVGLAGGTLASLGGMSATGSTLSLTSLLINGTALGTESTVTLGPVTLTNGVAANVGSLSLAAGLWILSGIIEFTATTASTLDFKSGSSGTSATFGGLGTCINQPLIATGLTDAQDLPVPLWRFDFRTVSGNTPVYIVASSSFTLGSIVVNAFARAVVIG